MKWDSLHDVASAIGHGESVGDIQEDIDEIGAKECTELLVKFGSEPGFFRLDDEDNLPD